MFPRRVGYPVLRPVMRVDMMVQTRQGQQTRNGALGPVREWRIHLGAHKTATTHLQQTLQVIRPELIRQGTDVIPTEQLRRVMPQHLRRRNWKLWLGGAPMRRDLEKALAPLRSGPDRVLLSEENFLGHMHEAVALPIYSQAEWRLRGLASLRGRANLQLFLSIRSMDRFLAASYAEALRHFPFQVTLAARKQQILMHPPRWVDLVRRIRHAFPGVAIDVWRYEDYQDHAAAITAMVCGTDPGPLPNLPRPVMTQTPSDAAVAEAERLGFGLSHTERAEHVGRIYAAAPAGNDVPPFSPFTAAEAQVFRDAYSADCAALASEGCLHRF